MNVEDAKHAVSVVLSRWQWEEKETADEMISAIHADVVSHCLIGFRIDDVRRISGLSQQASDARKPCLDYFLADVSLTLTPRPWSKPSVGEVRANAADADVVSRVYHVKYFADATWLVMADAS
jgi:hypothetical protein